MRARGEGLLSGCGGRSVPWRVRGGGLRGGGGRGRGEKIRRAERISTLRGWSKPCGEGELPRGDGCGTYLALLYVAIRAPPQAGVHCDGAMDKRLGRAAGGRIVSVLPQDDPARWVRAGQEEVRQ